MDLRSQSQGQDQGQKQGQRQRQGQGQDAGSSLRRFGIAEVQATVVSAWQAGFDPISAAQLGGAALRSSKSWIGAPECLAALGHLRVNAWMVEVTEVRGAGQALVDALAAYFRAREPKQRLPVYLQHKGHSRLAIGVLPRGAGSPTGAVILRDPADRASPLRVQIVPAAKLNGRQYQLVFADAGTQLREEEVILRKGDPHSAAHWEVGSAVPARGAWRYAHWFPQQERFS